MIKKKRKKRAHNGGADNHAILTQTSIEKEGKRKRGRERRKEKEKQ